MTASPSDLLAAERLLFEPVSPDPEAVAVVYAFPNTYTVGITSLGYQMIWQRFAQRADVAVTRLFTDLQDGSLPGQPDLFGFSVSWELDYVNILSLLEQQGIPIWSQERGDSDPLIFGGGAVLTANPEPFAPFFDLILMGDGEGLIETLVEAIKPLRGLGRQAKLQQLAQVPGIYVPSFYEVTYAGDPVAAIQPLEAGIPTQVAKHLYRGEQLSTSSVVTVHAAWPDIYMVEVVRSCPEMCRFCLASYLTLPFRVAPVQNHLIPAVEKGLGVTRRLGLLGASVTQHPHFSDLLEYLAQDAFADVRVSVSSVRAGTVTPRLAQILAERGSKSLTIAVESGSERLRHVVNKKLETAEIHQAAAAAQAGGLKALKLYGMVGIPSEQEEDVAATLDMVKDLKHRSPGLRYTLGCSTFVPKAQTPFQWYGVDPKAEKRLKYLTKHLRSAGIDFRPESYNWSVIQALISRGDRRVAQVLNLARGYGDSLGSYRRAFKDLKGQIPPLEFYVHHNWDVAMTLPWSHLQGSLSPERIVQHQQTALAAMAPVS